jgi:GNAT superfamily N-acetyltransferase
VLIQNREITHPDVTLLVRNAEDELHSRYPDQTPSPLDPNARFVVAYVRGVPVGCGALAPFDTGVAEVKRMYVQPGHRRRGVARRVLRALERRAEASGLDSLIVETGVRQPEALALYEAEGYERTEPFGEYVGNPYSVCLIKKLVPGR